MKQGTKIYLAASYNAIGEVRLRRDFLERLGYRVTSKWLDHHPNENGEPQDTLHLTTGFFTAAPELTRSFAEFDLRDVDAASVVIFMTDLGASSTGGRHTEFGYALARNKTVIVVGFCENMFQTLRQVRQHDTWELFISSIRYSRTSV